MAKAKQIGNLVNRSSGILTLPDGTDILPGEALADFGPWAENAGVQSWIDDGLLGEANPVPVSLTEELKALRTEDAELKAQVEELTKPK